MLEKTTLAPCPFCCSRRLHMAAASFTHKVVCEQCRCSGPQRRNRDDAVVEWNRLSQRVWQQQAAAESYQPAVSLV